MKIFRYRFAFAFIWLMAFIVIIIAGLTLVKIESLTVRGALIVIGASSIAIFGVYILIYILKPFFSFTNKINKTLEEQGIKVEEAEDMENIASSFSNALKKLKQEEIETEEETKIIDEYVQDDKKFNIKDISLSATIAENPQILVSEELFYKNIAYKLKTILKINGLIIYIKDKKNYYLKKYPFENRIEEIYINIADYEKIKINDFGFLTKEKDKEDRIFFLEIKDEEDVIFYCKVYNFDFSELGKIMSAKALYLKALIREIIISYNLTQQYDELRRAYLENIKKLAGIWENWHPYIKGHSRKVDLIVSHICEKAGISNIDKESVRIAAYLHDLGEIAISDLILHKPTALEETEKKMLNLHPKLTIKILDTLDLKFKVNKIVLAHHEKYDGTGYPLGLKESQIPIGSKIIAIADAFASMTSDRPYREKLSLNDALKEIKKYAGTQFDPDLVKLIEDNWYYFSSSLEFTGED